MPHIVETQTPSSPVSRIRREAERRMEIGILVNAHPFRADDASTQRVGELLAAFQDGLIGAEGVRFRTAGGVAFAVTDQAQVQAIYVAQRRYRAACLAASDDLQSTLPGDPIDDSHWPERPSITLP